MNDLLGLDQRLAHLDDDAMRLASAVEAGDLSAPVAACPGWDVRKLAVHVGFIHRWATHAIQQAASPDVSEIHEPAAEATAEELGAWLRLGAGVLGDVLATTPLDSSTWHPFPFAQTATFWSRRQMVETAMHRWDAEVAIDGSSTIDPVVATVGIAEYFDLGLPRILQRHDLAAPTSALRVRCTDEELPAGSGEWCVRSHEGAYRVDESPIESDATLAGSSAGVLLVLMGRADRNTLDVSGDPDAASAWLDLPGW